MRAFAEVAFRLTALRGGELPARPALEARVPVAEVEPGAFFRVPAGSRPNSPRSTCLARSSTSRWAADMPRPARLISKFSMDIAERKGALLRRALCSAERFSDTATERGLRRVKTPFSRSIASLVRMTFADQRRGDLAGLLIFRFDDAPVDACGAGFLPDTAARPLTDRFARPPVTCFAVVPAMVFSDLCKGHAEPLRAHATIRPNRKLLNRPRDKPRAPAHRPPVPQATRSQ